MYVDLSCRFTQYIYNSMHVRMGYTSQFWPSGQGRSGPTRHRSRQGRRPAQRPDAFFQNGVMAPFLVWLVAPERSRRSRLYERRVTASRHWCFFHELLKQPDKDVINSRLAAAKFPPWPDVEADGRQHDDHAAVDYDRGEAEAWVDRLDLPEAPWSQWRARCGHALRRARGRVVGAAILSAPSAAINQLQLHTSEHRVWERGTLPSLKSRLATFKVLDVFAFGNFMWPSAVLAANDPMLHPVYTSNRSDCQGAWDCVTNTCVQEALEF